MYKDEENGTWEIHIGSTPKVFERKDGPMWSWEGPQGQIITIKELERGMVYVTYRVTDYVIRYTGLVYEAFAELEKELYRHVKRTLAPFV